MLRETSAVAVAGLNRLVLVAWSIACVLSALFFGLFALLKVLGLFGAIVMVTMSGPQSPEQVQSAMAIHVVTIAVMAAFALWSYVLFGRAARRIQQPFVDSVRDAATLVHNVESGVKAGSGSLMGAAKQALEEARSSSDSKIP